MSSFRRYSMEEAKQKLMHAVSVGRVRVITKDGDLLSGDAALEALARGDRSVSFYSPDVIKEFPPLAPGGNA